MNKKSALMIVGMVLSFADPVLSQTNLDVPPAQIITTNYRTVMVTNWLQPQERYCFIGTQLYDKYRSSKFFTVQIPASAQVSIPYNGPVDSIPHCLQLKANWSTQQMPHDFTIKNFQFIRSQWNPAVAGWTHPGGGGFSFQAMLISDSPVYNPAGAMIVEIKEYDCGTPLTAPYPLASPVRVPVLKTNGIGDGSDLARPIRARPTGKKSVRP